MTETNSRRFALDQRNIAMAELYLDEKMSITEIGRRYGITRQRVSQILSKMKVPMRSPRKPKPLCVCGCGRTVKTNAQTRAHLSAYSPEKMAELTEQTIALYDEGLSLRKIAERLGIYRGLPGQLMEKAGRPRRVTGRWLRSPEERRQAIRHVCAAKQEGLSFRAIGRQLNVGCQTVKRWYEAGIKEGLDGGSQPKGN